MKKKPDKKKTQLLEDFLELGEKCKIKIIHDKGDFNVEVLKKIYIA